MIDKVNSLSLNLTNELQELDTLSTRKILNEESYTKSTIEKVLDFMESSQFFSTLWPRDINYAKFDNRRFSFSTNNIFINYSWRLWYSGAVDTQFGKTII